MLNSSSKILNNPIFFSVKFLKIIGSICSIYLLVLVIKVWLSFTFNKTHSIRESEKHAFKEGEGDRSLEYWRVVHAAFLTNELASVHMEFDENTKVVCEEFELVYKR